MFNSDYYINQIQKNNLYNINLESILLLKEREKIPLLIFYHKMTI